MGQRRRKGVMKMKEGGDGLGQGMGGKSGWGGGAGRMLPWQQTDWQKCKQSLLVQGEGKREVSAP